MLGSYIRNQKILDNLKMSLQDLHNRKSLLIDELRKIEIQLTKHEQYLRELTDND